MYFEIQRNLNEKFDGIIFYAYTGKFLKKLWCCVGWKSIAGNLVLTTELKT